jgi:hypothetical protein
MRPVARYFPALLFFIAGINLHGQLVTASLEGTVIDPSGSGVPDASVQIQNTATGVTVTVHTSTIGHYVAPSLQPGGPYTILVDVKGFKKAVRSGISLDVNQQATVDIPLQIGSPSQTVEVTGEAPLLEASSAAIGQVVDNRSIVNLPLNQRNAYSLVFLVPGTTGAVSYQYNSANISINGGRPGSTDILVDGIPSSPPAVNPIQSFAVFPSVDAVQEFKVQTNGYSAEFGRSGGGIINLIYKSGTNNFHGSAFEFLRNSDLDSNNFFSNERGTHLPSFKRSQFGGSLGGPVWLPKIYNGKDKTFFFTSYEGLRQGSASTVTTTVPTLLQRQGNFSQTTNAAGQLVQLYNPYTTVASGSGYVRQVFAGNVLPATLLNPVSLNILNYYPLPNQPGTASGANNYYDASVTKLNSNQVDVKVDENINDRNRFFVRYSRRFLDQAIPPLFPASDMVAEGQVASDNTPTTSNSAAVDYTFTASPTLLFDFRYGFARNYLNFTAISSGFNPTSLGFPNYVAASADHLIFPTVTVSNYVSLGDGNQGQEREGSFQTHLWGMNATKILSNHTLKFGAEARVILVNDDESGCSTGCYAFTQALTQGPNPNAASSTAGNAFGTFLLGVGSGSVGIDLKNAATKSDVWGWYFQDDWKVTRKLALNLGLRYELDVPRTERYNRMTSFDTSIASPLGAEIGDPSLTGGVIFAGVNGQPRRQFSTPLKDWAPRFGFSYQLIKNTVLRGGYGIFYSPSYREAGATIGQEGFGSSTSYVGSPNGLTPSVFLNNPFPTGLNPPLGSSQGLLTGIGSSFESPVTGDSRIPYSQNWNFDVQRELPANILIDVAYVGSHSIHLTECGENDCNLDQLTPQALALGTKLQASVPNPFFGRISTGPLSAATVPQSYLLAPYPQFTAVDGSYLTGGFSFYDAIEAKVEKRFSQGFSVLVSFTGQKLIDDYSIISNVGTNASVQNIYNIQGEKAVSANDISRALVISGVYNLPFGRGQKFGGGWNKATDAFLGGWQINGIATDQTGFPLALSTQNTSDSGDTVLRPNNNGQSAGLNGPIINRLNEYFTTSVFSQPAPFTFGDTGRTLPNVRAPGYHNIDFSLFKNFQLTEHLKAELRGEAFNILNEVVFGAPNTSLSSGQFGVISSQSNTPREVQIALKLLF